MIEEGKPAPDFELESDTGETVKLSDLRGRALVIHEGGDNYTDNPENGGGKGRIACGVVPPG